MSSPGPPGAATTTVTGELVRYVEGAVSRPLPDGALQATKHHVLDTLAASVSGSRLPAGVAAAGYVRDRGEAGPCVVVGQPYTASPAHAALANAMAAHADESDDTHELSMSHPGCSIVPAALATAEETRSTGPELLRAVALGYDVGCRLNMALWPSFTLVRSQKRGTTGTAGTFGSGIAAAALRGLDASRLRSLLSYMAQQASGVSTWKRDHEHVEKAYVFAGWPAFSAMFAVSVVEHGWPGVQDVFAGDLNVLDIVGTDPDPTVLTDALGTRFEVERTHIKLHAVGSPAQAPIQALLELMRRESLTDQDVAAVEVTLPTVLARTAKPSRMPDINLHYLLSTVLADGDFSFAAAHDHGRFRAWEQAGGDPRITSVADDRMEPSRQAVVVVTTVGGARFRNHLTTVVGSPGRPLSDDQVRAKAADLIGPALGRSRAEQITAAVLSLEDVDDLGVLSDLLRAGTG